ncbi:MAG TPA: hypothetical protein VGT41_01350 [Candidatus Babeliales bacterium]|nr:hypothetical protein [Candidatus Babeliales bacterium]
MKLNLLTLTAIPLLIITTRALPAAGNLLEEAFIHAEALGADGLEAAYAGAADAAEQAITRGLIQIFGDGNAKRLAWQLNEAGAAILADPDQSDDTRSTVTRLMAIHAIVTTPFDSEQFDNKSEPQSPTSFFEDILGRQEAELAAKRAFLLSPQWRELSPSIQKKRVRKMLRLDLSTTTKDLSAALQQFPLAPLPAHKHKRNGSVSPQRRLSDSPSTPRARSASAPSSPRLQQN